MTKRTRLIIAQAADWTGTTLWNNIQKSTAPDASLVIGFLNIWMPRIQLILNCGGTSPTAFTLHDASHAFRVAQRMMEILPKGTRSQLSIYENTLLLLSAYLHDIGMTPEEQKVISHYNLLLTGDTTFNLSTADLQRFQQWLDGDDRGIRIPLAKGRLDPETLQLARELTTYYCRYRHNDWSEVWIRKNLTGGSLGQYTGWLDDLIALCRSHHEGKPALCRETFNPRPVGSGPTSFVHLRYLACVLRVADVLEFDPERTPEVILTHREIPLASLLYWHKDHGISMIIERERISISARPPNAKLHRAIESMIDEIDHELGLCRAIADETHFEVCPSVRSKLPHRWELQATVHRDLHPKNDAYEYINGAFRPNTRKLLELLSGTQLYHDSLAAVRELLQNAFDAVREQIAYERLARSDGSTPFWEEQLGRNHRVELRAEVRPDGVWLVCSDSGVGMTKSIITDHLLIAGQARRHDIIALERRCEAAGFTTGRTGQFGIGVLSYFMIADRLILTTRRKLETEDSESTGWRFTTDGVGSFGELRRDTSISGGSRVELHLKANPGGDFVSFYKGVRNRLLQTLRHVPCEFQFTSDQPGCESLNMMPGWTTIDPAINACVLRGIKRPHRNEQLPEDLLSDREKREREIKSQHLEAVEDEVMKCLKLLTENGSLSEGLGRYQIRIPYFELSGGISLGFLRVNPGEHGNLSRIRQGWSLLPRSETLVSWKGMQIESHFSERPFSNSQQSAAILQIDFFSDQAGALSVDRTSIKLSEKGERALKQVEAYADKLTREFVERHADSRYAVLNRRVCRMSGIDIAQPCWLSLSTKTAQEQNAQWKYVSAPLITSLPWVYLALPTKVTWKGRPVEILSCLCGPEDSEHYRGVAFVDSMTIPDRIVKIHSDWKLTMLPLWTKNPFTKPKAKISLERKCAFPPNWKHVSASRFASFASPGSGATIWNRSNLLVSLATNDAWRWAATQTAKNTDPLSIKDQLLKDKTKAAAWLLQFVIQNGNYQLWEGLIDRDRYFLEDIWRLLFGKTKKQNTWIPITSWHEETTDSKLRVVTPDVWLTYERSDDIYRYLPEPDKDWTIEVEKIPV